MTSAGIKDEETVSKCITDLHNWGFISIISRNRKVKNSKDNLPNIYQIKNFKTEENDNVFKICNRKTLCSNCFFTMIKECYDSKELNSVVTRSIKYKIIKLDNSNCCMLKNIK
jgi:hypothetical protein